MNETLKSLDFRHLERRLAELEIQVGQSVDGKYVACSFSEPLFCLERNTEAEAKQAVIDTLISYIHNFYSSIDTNEIRVGIHEEQLAIPHQFLNPISRLRPEFQAQDGDRAYATA